MRKIILLYLLAAISFMGFSQTKILLTVGERTMKATLVDNAATRELQSLLQNGPITIQMNDYGGFEKVGKLPQPLPTSNTQITTGPGDIMLYQGNNMVIFYDSNSWSYTPLGKIDGATADNLRQFLGAGSIALQVSLDASSRIEQPISDNTGKGTICDLNGNQITTRPLPPGIYVVNGKKTLIKH